MNGKEKKTIVFSQPNKMYNINIVTKMLGTIERNKNGKFETNRKISKTFC